MKKLASVLAAGLLAATAAQSHAGVTFSFTESGGTVNMQSSGTLNTANLVSQSTAWWGGVGIETNGVPESDIMGDTTTGGLNAFFGFHQGTDLSPWIGNMFTNSYFNWTTSGSTQFATWFWGDKRTPGISVNTEDLQGNLWIPDVSWSTSGTLAGLGLTAGNYKIVDAVTNESITIHIGAADVSVPEPSTLMLFGLGLLGLGLKRKKA